MLRKWQRKRGNRIKKEEKLKILSLFPLIETKILNKQILKEQKDINLYHEENFKKLYLNIKEEKISDFSNLNMEFDLRDKKENEELWRFLSCDWPIMKSIKVFLGEESNKDKNKNLNKLMSKWFPFKVDQLVISNWHPYSSNKLLEKYSKDYNTVNGKVKTELRFLCYSFTVEQFLTLLCKNPQCNMISFYNVEIREEEKEEILMDDKVNITTKTLTLGYMLGFTKSLLIVLVKAMANNLSLKYFLETVKYSPNQRKDLSLKEVESVFRQYGIKAKIVGLSK